MPCTLFTYHAYGSWLPDHPRGYVKRGHGIQPTNHRLSAIYADNMSQREAVFDRQVQRLLIEAALDACRCQDCRCHFVATEPTHVHVLLSWPTDRPWETVRRQISRRANLALNELVERRQWFAKSPSRRQVKARDHFEYLVTTYLPKHQGLKGCEAKGVYT